MPKPEGHKSPIKARIEFDKFLADPKHTQPGTERPQGVDGTAERNDPEWRKEGKDAPPGWRKVGDTFEEV